MRNSFYYITFFGVYLGIFLKIFSPLTTFEQGQICIVLQGSHFLVEHFLCYWLTGFPILAKSTEKLVIMGYMGDMNRHVLVHPPQEPENEQKLENYRFCEKLLMSCKYMHLLSCEYMQHDMWMHDIM